MPDELEAPETASSLYLARGADVNVDRPLIQGDVFVDIEIPGVDDGAGIAAILTHPCTMRRDGVHLVERLLVARVVICNPIPLDRWDKGNYKVMPLPELLESDEHFAVNYELCGRVQSSVLQEAGRIACLDPLGICLLLQRLVHHQSRAVIPTRKFHQSCAAVFEEVELAEDWVGTARAVGDDAEQAAEEFHELLRAPREGEVTLQEALQEPARRAYVRRAIRAAIKDRFGVEV
jgi:hypothetical protein